MEFCFRKLDYMKHKKIIYISLRNIALMILVFFSVLFSIEKIMNIKKEDKVIYDQVLSKEENIVRYMNFKKTPLENLKTSKLASKYFSIFSIDEFISDCPPAHYPVIDVKGNEQYDDDTFNIVIIGDSFVWGDGCTNRNELFWRQLEIILREKQYDCRVYAVGMGAANAYEELSWLVNSDLSDKFSPDIVLFGYVENDADKRSDFIISQSPDWKEKLPWLYHIRNVFPNIYTSLTKRLEIKTLYNQKYNDSEYGGNDIAVLKGNIYEDYKNNFVDPLNVYAENADFPIVVMTLPSEPYLFYYKQLYGPLYELYSGAENIHFYDCLKDFASYDAPQHKNNYAMSKVNSHPGTASNYFYANYIADFLEKDFALESKCKKIGTEKSTVFINDTMPGELGVKKVYADDNKAEYLFTYPSVNTVHETEYYSFPDLLNYPIENGYVKLCFSHPTDISSLKFVSEEIDGIELYYTKKNEKLGYDDHTVFYVEKQHENDSGYYDLDLTDVTSLCIHADTKKGKAAEIKVTINTKSEN